MERQSFGPSGSNPVAEEQFRKGFELAKQGNLDEAILAVEAAIAVSPEEGRYHDLMGTLYAKKGLYEMAVSEWKRSIECDPSHAEVFRRIETANKLKTHAGPRGDKWGWVAAGTVSILLVVACAWGTYQQRSQGALRGALADAESALADVEGKYVLKSDHQAILDMSEELSRTIGNLESQVAAKDETIEDLRDDSKFVRKEVLEEEIEQRNRIESDLKAAREQVVRLEQQLEAVGDTSGSTTLSQRLTAKEQELVELANNYKTQNDDRLRLERELNASRQRVGELEAETAALRSQVPAEGVGTIPAASATREADWAPLLEGAFRAVVEANTGNREAALASLRGLENAHPEAPGLKSAIAALAPATVEAPVAAEPTATPTPIPTAAPTTPPRPTVAPTAAPISRPAGPVTPARPRPVGGSGPSIAERPQPAPTRAPAPVQDDRAEQARRLQQQKAAFTQQAYQAYQGRDFQRAKQLIERAYRIDPNDRAIQQLRGAIDRSLGE